MVLSQSAAPHDVAPRCARSQRPPWVRTPRQPTTHWSMRCGATRVEPPFRPSPCAPRAHARRAGHPTASPPYSHRATHGWRLPAGRRRPSRRTPAMLRPIPGLALTWCPSQRLNRLELGYKAGRTSPRASTEPPPSAMGATR
jgi:hypothetical protein